MSWADEVRKEYKEGRNAQNRRRENSWVESVRAEYRPHNAALDAQKSSWFKEASDFIQQSSAGLQERSKAYQDAGTFEKYRQDTASRAKKLLQDSDPVRELATRIVDEKQRKQYLDTVAGMQQYLSAVPKDLDSLKEYWSQWGSQADYEQAIRGAERQEKQKQARENMGKLLADEEARRRLGLTGISVAHSTFAEPNQQNQVAPILSAAELRNHIAELEQRQKEQESKLKGSGLAGWMTDTFGSEKQKSQSFSEYDSQLKDEIASYKQQLYYAENDEALAAIPENTRRKMEQYTARAAARQWLNDMGGAESVYDGTNAKVLLKNGKRYTIDEIRRLSSELKDDELGNLYGEIESLGMDGHKLLKYMQLKQGQEFVKLDDEETRQVAHDHPILTSAASILHTPFKVAGIINTGATALSNAITGQEAPVDYSQAVYDSARYQSSARGQVSDDLGGGLGSFLYQTGMSMGDFLTLAPLAAVPGGQSAVTAILGGGAATDAAMDISNRGGTASQAFWGGLAAGAAEAAFEKFSLEAILKAGDVTGVKSFITEMLKGAGIEGSEEVATEIANIISDQLIMGNKSNYSLAVQAYMQSGMNRQEAEKAARLDLLKQVGTAFAGGALSGGLIHAVHGGANYAGNAHLGGDIIQNNQVRDAIRMGFESDVDSPAYRAAVELSEQMVNGEKLSPARVGAMVADAQQQAVSGQGVDLRQVAQEAVNGGNTLRADIDVPQVKNAEFAASEASVRTLKGMGADTAQAQVNSRLADRTSMEQSLQGDRDPSIGTKAAAMLVSDIENAVPVRVENGESAAITDVQFENPQVESLYYAAANYETNTARAFVSGYNGSVPLKTYKTAFDFLHNQAMRGVPFETAVQQLRQSAGLVSQMVGTQAQYMAYHSGVNEASLQKSKDRGTIETERVHSESREAFEARNMPSSSEKRGTKVEQHGNSAIAYTQAQTVSPESEAGKAAAAFEKSGIHVVVTKGAFETNGGGVTIRHTEAMTAPDGTVYIADNTTIPAEHVVPHEGVHVLQKQGSPAYDAYYDVLVGNADWDSDAYKEIANIVNKAHYEGKLVVEDLDSAKLIFTELTAYIHQQLVNDPEYAQERFSGMFKNWDAVVEASRILTHSMEEERIHGKEEKEVDIRGVRSHVDGSSGRRMEAGTETTRSGENTPIGKVLGVASQSVRGGQEEAPSRGTGVPRRGVTREYTAPKLSPAQKKQIAILDAYGKAHGISFVMVDTIEDGRANGYYKDGVIRIALDAQEQGYLVTAGHEVFHYLEEKAPEQTAKLREYVCGELKNSMGADAYEALVQERMAQYNTTDRLLAESEIAANGLFDVFRSESAVQRLAKTNRALALKVRTALTNFLHELNKIVVKLSANREEIAALRGNAEVLQEIAERFDEALNAAQGTKKAAQKNGERYALNPNFAAEYDAWDKRSAGGRFKIGTTSEALQSIGIDPSRIYWDKSKIIQIKKKHPGMTDEAIKNVPAILENPIVVMQSQTVANRVVLFGELVDASGNPVLAALELQPKNNRCEIGDFVKVASAYGKEGTSSIQRLLDTSEILFIDPDKNRTDSWLQARRLQLPVGVASRYGSIGKVTYSHKNVNGEIVVESKVPTKSAIQIAFEQAEKNSTNTSIAETPAKDTGRYSLKTKAVNSDGETLTEGQAQYFENSQARDGEGRLLVVYHATDADFTVFDKAKQGSANDPGVWGSGFYFDADRSFAEEFGSKSKPYYLNITNPLRTTYDADCHVVAGMFRRAGIEIPFKIRPDTSMLEFVKKFGNQKFSETLRKLGYDGVIVSGEECVIYEPEQAKLTVNENPTANPDIRFSLKDVTEVDVKALTQENAALQEQVNLLKQEFRLTNGHAPSKKALDKLAGKILSQTHSKYSRETLAGNLEVVFQYIANDPEANFTEAMDALVDVSNSVLQQSSVMNRKLYDEYADMREYFRKTGLSLSDSVKADLTDGYASFRARNFGRMNLVNDGMAMDEAWAEISGMWPEFFSADTNAADQPIAVAEALRSVEPTYENPYGMNNADAAQDLALQVYEEYFSIPEVHTFADKQNAKLEQLRAKYSSKLERARQKAKERNELQKELFREKMEAQASKRKESAAVRKYKPRIIRDTMELGRWLNRPTEQKHVPEPLRETVAEFLNSIDFSSSRTNRYGEPTMRTTAWANLRDQLTKVQNGEFSDDVRAMLDTADPDLIPNLADLIENAKTFRLDEMTGEQLRELSKTVAALKSMIVNANKMLTSAQSETADVIASGVHNDLLSRKNAKELTGVPGMAQKMLQFDMLDAPSYFEELGTTAYGKLYKPLRQGFDVKIQDTRTAIEYMQETLNGIDTKEWSGEKSAMHVFHVSGGSITLTTAQVMSLYELSKRKQAMGHILGGGIKAAPIQRGWFNGKRLGLPHMESSTRPITLSADDVQAIVRSLTAEQRKVADRIADFFKTTSHWGNEVSSQMYGYSKFTEENYFPIVSDKDYLTTMQGDLKKPDAILKNLGITKSTVAGANNPIVIEDIFDVFTRQVDQMSSYHAFVVPLADLQKVLNFKVSGEGGKVQGSTKETLNRVFGRAGISYLNKLVEDINGMSRGLPPTLGDKLLSNMKAAAVGANLRVVIQQPTAYVRAAAMVDPKYLAKGLAMKSDLETMNRYAPISYWKDIGFFEMDTSRGMRDILLGKERLRDLTMKPAGWADKITWGKLWNAVTAEIADTRSELKEGTEAFYKACGSRFSDIVDRTQVVDSVLHRSQLMRSKNFIDKTVTSFMSEPTKSYNLLRSAMRDVQNGGGAAARKRLARASMAFVVTSIATAAAAALVDSFRDDDRDKKWWNKFLDAFGSNTIDNMNPINMIPYLKDLGSLVSGYSLTRQEMAGFTDVSYSVRKWMKYFEGASEYSAAYLVKDSAASLSKLLGLPISSILREVEAVTNGSLGLLEEAGVPIARIRYTLDTMIYPVNEKNASRYADYLYDAIADGDAKFADKIRGSLSAAGKSDDAISTMIRQRLVKNDTDVAKAAIARLGGNLDEYERLVYQIRDKGFGQDLAVGAVNNYMTALETAAGYRRGGKEGKYNDKISSIISPGMDEETADKVRALTIELSGKPQAENEEEDDKEPTSLYKASDVENALMEKGLDDALSTADAIIKEVKEQTSSLPLKEQEKKLDAKISAIKSGVTSQYKKLYIAAFKRKDFKETQSIMRLLSQIRVNGKRLFTQDDFKSWNKDAQKKE